MSVSDENSFNIDQASHSDLVREAKARELPAGGSSDAIRERIREHDAGNRAEADTGSDTNGDDPASEQASEGDTVSDVPQAADHEFDADGAPVDDDRDEAAELYEGAEVYSVADLPVDVSEDENWGLYRKTALTNATRLDGPFVVETSEGPLRCEDGFLAVDARGYPYPIAAEEFELIYEPVHGEGDADDEDVDPADFADDDEDETEDFIEDLPTDALREIQQRVGEVLDRRAQAAASGVDVAAAKRETEMIDEGTDPDGNDTVTLRRPVVRSDAMSWHDPFSDHSVAFPRDYCEASGARLEARDAEDAPLYATLVVPADQAERYTG